MISRKAGLVVHDMAGSRTHELRAWGRTLAFYKESGDNEYRVEAFHQGDNDKKYRKFIRKNARFLRALFQADGDLLSIRHGEHGVKISLGEEVGMLVSAEVRSEIYLPIAYERAGALAGGMYAYIWRCDDAEREGTAQAALSQRPVTSIVTGMCMFGTNIWGIDQHGTKHPLTNTFHVMPENACIQSITLESDDWHPYEKMMLDLFDLQMPMLKAMGQGQQKVFYQSVYEEYVLYGFQRFLLGQMCMSALCAYVDHVHARAWKIRDHVAAQCQRHGVDIDDGASTLSSIVSGGQDRTARGTDVVERFINLHQIHVRGIRAGSFAQGSALVQQVFWRCLSRLSGLAGIGGDVWRRVHQALVAAREEGSAQYDAASLLTINFLHYSAKVAIVRMEHPEGELCLSHPFHEKPMALAYKELHAEACGGILCMNWIPPLFTHGAFKDGLYYLEQDKVLLNELIADGVLELCAIETGALAIGNVSAKAQAAGEVQTMLASRLPGP